MGIQDACWPSGLGETMNFRFMETLPQSDKVKGDRERHLTSSSGICTGEHTHLYTHMHTPYVDT